MNEERRTASDSRGDDAALPRDDAGARAGPDSCASGGPSADGLSAAGIDPRDRAIDAWAAALRSEGRTSGDFADRVMARIAPGRAAPSESPPVAGVAGARREDFLRTAAIALAVVAAGARIAATIVVFVAR